MHPLWQYISHLAPSRDGLHQDIFPIIFSNQLAAVLSITNILLLFTHLLLGDWNMVAVRFVIISGLLLTIWSNKKQYYQYARHLLLFIISIMSVMTIFVNGAEGNYKMGVLLLLLCTVLLMDNVLQYILYAALGVATFIGCYHIAPHASLLVEPDHAFIYTMVSNAIVIVMLFFFVFVIKNEMIRNRLHMRNKQMMLKESNRRVEQQNRHLQKAYDRIHMREQELSTIAENIPIGIGVIAEEMVCLASNQHFRHFFQLPNNTNENASLDVIPMKHIDPQDSLQIRKAIDGQLVKYEKKVLSKTGERTYLHCTLIPMDSTFYKNKGCYFFVENRTVIKEKEMELLRSNAQLIKEVEKSNQLKREQSYALSLLETTLESTPYGIWVTNNEGETERFNQSFIKLWGINSAVAASDDTLLNKAILEQVHDAEVFKNKLREIELHPTQQSRDLLHLKDGRVVERYSRPHIHRNEVIGRVWTFLDITAQKHIEHQLVAANQELQQFASVASHDMKEPLRTISSFSTLLSRRIPDQPAAQEYLHFIKDAAGRMTNLLEDLINYARADRSQEDLKPVSLERILLLVQNNLHSTIQQNQVQIESVPLPTVMGQSTPFIQLFQNLIANAIKFQKADNRPIIKIELKELGSYWQIGIRDNGIGMAVEYLDRIFKPFTRLHSHAEYKGSGIGLATCTKIVQHYGGRIWVESELDVGTVFYFTIPKMKEEQPIEMPLEISLKN